MSSILEAGTWNVATVCQPPIDTMGCTDLTYSVDADRSSGTVTLEANGTYYCCAHCARHDGVKGIDDRV